MGDLYVDVARGVVHRGQWDGSEMIHPAFSEWRQAYGVRLFVRGVMVHEQYSRDFTADDVRDISRHLNAEIHRRSE